MGLGPLICPECLVYADLVKDNDGPGEWRCPCCGSEALDYYFMFTDAEQAQVSVNQKFIRFIAGEDESNHTRS